MPATIRFAASCLALLLVASCSCGRDPKAIEAGNVDRASAPGAPSRRPDAADAAMLAAEAQAKARTSALWGAADAVQRYLGHAGAGKWTEADRLWARNRAPRAHEEAGLRSLAPLRALRSQTGAPRVLDAEPVPASVEIPVDIRVTTKTGETLRYEGWYRLRRDPVELRWLITAASIHPRLR
jgi:hypothetical protein